ncbi:hypothetical protein CHU98_g10965 [Xylaria longipes]|nr:hypothetical protein CHU98_g10965 [Xylaria longipes]
MRKRASTAQVPHLNVAWGCRAASSHIGPTANPRIGHIATQKDHVTFLIVNSHPTFNLVTPNILRELEGSVSAQSRAPIAKMKHLAAYLLLGLAGNTSPSAKDIKKVLDSVGIEADDSRLETLVSELEGKDVNELIAEGSSKLASVPSGGAGGAAAAGGAAGAGGAAAAEEKAEEKEEEKEESDDDMGFGLFD